MRHSPSLYNLAWQPAYAWDGSAPQIRDQAKNAMTSSFEMNGDLAKIAARLGQDAGGGARVRAGVRIAGGESGPHRAGLGTVFADAGVGRFEVRPGGAGARCS